MSEKKLKVDSDDDDEDDDDYCPTKIANEQSDPSDDSGHDDDDEKEQDEQIDSEKPNDLNIKPYDESKTNELWKNFTSSTKPSSTTTTTEDSSKTITEKPKPAVEIPKPITKIFDYAGEKVVVPVTTTAISPSLKRPAASSSTANSLLDRLGIGKKQKLSTLEKSRLDWSTHKESEALTDDLNSHRRGKDSYVEKTAFLQRTESREHDNYLTRLKKK